MMLIKILNFWIMSTNTTSQISQKVIIKTCALIDLQNRRKPYLWH